MVFQNCCYAWCAGGAAGASWAKPGIFTQTQRFDEPGTYYYADSHGGRTSLGQVNVMPLDAVPQAAGNGERKPLSK